LHFAACAAAKRIGRPGIALLPRYEYATVACLLIVVVAGSSLLLVVMDAVVFIPNLPEQTRSREPLRPTAA
jgi:hypothetical protein